MDDKDKGTPDPDPKPTGEDKPATDDKGKGATPPPKADDKDTVSIPREDYDELVKQRDKKANDNKTLEEKVEELLEKADKKNIIDEFLVKNAEKYPHVDKEALQLAESEEQIEKIAVYVEGIYEKHKEEAYKSVTNVPVPPPLTEEDAKKAKAELEKDGKSGTFQGHLSLQGKKIAK